MWGGISAAQWSVFFVLALEFVLLGMIVFGLYLQEQRQERREQTREKFRRYVDLLIDKLDSQEEVVIGDAIPRGKRRLLRQLLYEEMVQDRKERRPDLLRLYEQLGFIEDDRREARSRNWRVKLLALRRLYVIPDFYDRQLLLEGLSDHYRVRLVCAHILARRGEVADLIEALNSLSVPSNLMEQPIYSLLRQVDDERLGVLLENLGLLEAGRVRRAVMVSAAVRQLPGILTHLQELKSSTDVHVRVGVCVSAGVLQESTALSLLLDLLVDPAWEVRAQAAKSLSGHDDPKVLMPLATTMNDPDFWVRQSAAMAMHSVRSAPGPKGLPESMNGGPSLEDLCHFDDYLKITADWVPRMAGPRGREANKTSPMPVEVSS